MGERSEEGEAQAEKAALALGVELLRGDAAATLCIDVATGDAIVARKLSKSIITLGWTCAPRTSIIMAIMRALRFNCEIGCSTFSRSRASPCSRPTAVRRLEQPRLLSCCVYSRQDDVPSTETVCGLPTQILDKAWRAATLDGSHSFPADRRGAGCRDSHRDNQANQGTVLDSCLIGVIMNEPGSRLRSWP